MVDGEIRDNSWPAGCFSKYLLKTLGSVAFLRCPYPIVVTMKSAPKAAAFGELGRRARSLLWLKSIGVPAFMALFFWGYLYILKHAYFPVTTMPLTAIDRLIPYQVSGWLLYVSLWAYVQLPLTLIDNRRELFLYGRAATGISLIGFAFFILWPTAVPAISDDVAGSLFSGIRSIDTTGNSCPSLHVAFSVLTALWLERFLRKNMPSTTLRLLNALWCLGIVYSTLATKQHVAIDACAGAVLGFVGALVQARLEKQRGLPGSQPTVSSELAQINPAARKL
jgi:hypothetical protein